jgi:hypothetical protein
MRECLCAFEISQEQWPDAFTDVWLMKEYGKKSLGLNCFVSLALVATLISPI